MSLNCSARAFPPGRCFRRPPPGTGPPSGRPRRPARVSLPGLSPCAGCFYLSLCLCVCLFVCVWVVCVCVLVLVLVLLLLLVVVGGGLAVEFQGTCD